MSYARTPSKVPLAKDFRFDARDSEAAVRKGRDAALHQSRVQMLGKLEAALGAATERYMRAGEEKNYTMQVVTDLSAECPPPVDLDGPHAEAVLRKYNACFGLWTSKMEGARWKAEMASQVYQEARRLKLEEERRCEEFRWRIEQEDRQAAVKTERDTTVQPNCYKSNALKPFTPKSAPYDKWYKTQFMPIIGLQCRDDKEVLYNLMSRWVTEECWAEFRDTFSATELADLDACNAELERIFGETMTYEELTVAFQNCRQECADVEHYNRHKFKLYKRLHDNLTKDQIEQSVDYRYYWLKGVYKQFATEIAVRHADYMTCAFARWMKVCNDVQRGLLVHSSSYGNLPPLLEYKSSKKKSNNTNNSNSNKPCKWGTNCTKPNCSFTHPQRNANNNQSRNNSQSRNSNSNTQTNNNNNGTTARVCPKLGANCPYGDQCRHQAQTSQAQPQQRSTTQQQGNRPTAVTNRQAEQITRLQKACRDGRCAGTPTHNAFNCPNIYCENCGAKHHKFFCPNVTCNICNARGHATPAHGADKNKITTN